MVERGQCLGFAQEPGPPRRVGRQVHPQRDEPLQHPVPGLVQRPLARQRHEVLEPEGRLQRLGEAGEEIDGGRLRSRRGSRLRHPPPPDIRITTTAQPARATRV